jgi:hypothetical protein
MATSVSSTNDNINSITSEDREKQNREKIIKSIIHGVRQNFKRDRKIKDPVIKNMMLIKSFCIVLDSTLTGMLALCDDLSDNTKNNMHELIFEINEDMDNLIDWIQTPNLNPDSPKGNALMVAAEKHFNSMICDNTTQHKINNNKDNKDNKIIQI